MRSAASGRCQQAAEPAMALYRGAVTAAACLYLTTGSASTTVTGTTAWAVLAGWDMWLVHRSHAGQPSNPRPQTGSDRHNSLWALRLFLD